MEADELIIERTRSTRTFNQAKVVVHGSEPTVTIMLGGLTIETSGPDADQYVALGLRQLADRVLSEHRTWMDRQPTSSRS